MTPDLRKHVELYLIGTGAVEGDVGRSFREHGLVVEHPIDLVWIPIASFEHHAPSTMWRRWLPS
ncbi:MAG: hypothetical protein ACR2FE_04735 [Aeromicrobium sp.]